MDSERDRGFKCGDDAQSITLSWCPHGTRTPAWRCSIRIKQVQWRYKNRSLQLVIWGAIHQTGHTSRTVHCVHRYHRTGQMKRNSSLARVPNSDPHTCCQQPPPRRVSEQVYRAMRLNFDEEFFASASPLIKSPSTPVNATPTP